MTKILQYLVWVIRSGMAETKILQVPDCRSDCRVVDWIAQLLASVAPDVRVSSTGSQPIRLARARLAAVMGAEYCDLLKGSHGKKLVRLWHENRVARSLRLVATFSLHVIFVVVVTISLQSTNLNRIPMNFNASPTLCLIMPTSESEIRSC
jgi:hypothetical protein